MSAAVAGAGTVITGNAEASLDWVSTLAPRVGYAFNNWLVYGKVAGCTKSNMTAFAFWRGGIQPA